ncbi:MAG: TIGR02710 family CRISPR-associated CARF protein [Thermoguttaceae bacterium]
MTVGGAPESIAFSIREMSPDCVLLFVSAESQENLIKVWDLLDETLKLRCHEKLVDNPNDVQSLFTQFMQHLQQHVKDVNPEKKSTLWIDFTGGTKAMTAALVSAGIALKASELCYVIGEKNNPTGIAQKSEQVTRIKPAQILAERTISEARELFNRQDYAAAVMTVQHVKKQHERETHLGSLANVIFALGKAYEQWSLFQWEAASKTLQENKKIFRIENSPVSPDLIAKQAEFCNRLANGEYDTARLVDLLANAKRCFADKRYDDCTARLYRAFEYAIQIQLHEKYKINTSDFHYGSFREKLHENTQKKYKGKRKPIKLALWDSMELLAELQDEMGLSLVNQYRKNWVPGMDFEDGDTGSLQGYLTKRNNSFLAHGTKPIEVKDAKSLLDIFEQFLKSHLGEDEFQTMLETATFVQL